MRKATTLKKLKSLFVDKEKESLMRDTLKQKKTTGIIKLTVKKLDMLSADNMEFIACPIEYMKAAFKMSAISHPVFVTRLDGIKENLILLTLNSMTMQRKFFSTSSLTLNG